MLQQPYMGWLLHPLEHYKCAQVIFRHAFTAAIAKANYLQQWHRKTSISIPSTNHRNAARYSHPCARSFACPKEQIKFLHGYKDKDLHKFTKASWHLGTTVHKQYQLAHSTAPGRCPTFEHSGNHYAVLRKKWYNRTALVHISTLTIINIKVKCRWLHHHVLYMFNVHLHATKMFS